MGVDTEVFPTEILRREVEWRRCAKSFLYFISTYVFIWVKEGGDAIRFQPWPFQKKMARHFTKHRLAIILKTRQFGASWMADMYALWKVMFTANFHVYVQSIGQKEVAEQVERIKFIYANLPDWMQEYNEMGGRGRKDNDSLTEFANGSAIHAVATTKRAGHGAAPGLYILDEFARNEQDVMTWRAVKPALAGRGQVIIVSTSNGWGNKYEELWHGAEAGSNNFQPLFIPASAHPDYTPEFLEQERLDYAGDIVGFYEAYPETPEQAFMTSTRCPFDTERIGEAIRNIEQKKIVPTIGRLEETAEGVKFIKDDAGPLQVWRKPVLNHHYTVGTDVAEGLVSGDFSVSVVLDTVSDEIVALYRNKIPPENYAYPVRLLATYYNMAWLAVEVNKSSDLIIDDLKAEYPMLYCRERREKVYDEPTLVPGFYTSASSKPRIILQFRRYFGSRDKPLHIYSRTILKEMTTFEEDDKGRLKASGKKNYDDCVMAVAFAIEATNTMPLYDDDEYVPRHRQLGSMSL